MGSLIAEPRGPVSLDPTVLPGAEVRKTTHRVTNQLGKISADETGVLSRERDLALEHQVRTDEDAIPQHHARSESLVVGVANADRSTKIRVVPVCRDIQHTEVSLAATGECVRLGSDLVTAAVKPSADLVQ
jgi:hypothetical protein